MLRVIVRFLAVTLVAGCTSVAWEPRPAAEIWRGRSLWVTKEATVAASNEDAATSVLLVYRRVIEAFVAIGEVPPPPPLLIAVDVGDEVLLQDAERTARALPRWHLQVLGRDVPTHGGFGGSMLSMASPELLAAMVGAMTAAVPLADAELALPASWTRAGQWGMVMPTGQRIAATSDLTVDEAMANADLNFAERLLAAPFLPWARGMARDMLNEVMLRFLIEASCAPHVLGRPLADGQRIALLAEVGLPPEMQEPVPPVTDRAATK